MTATAAQFDVELEVTTYPDDASADAALAAEEVDVVVDVPADLSGPGEVRFDQSEDEALVQIVSASVAALRMQAAPGRRRHRPGRARRGPGAARGRDARSRIPNATRVDSSSPTSARCSSSSGIFSFGFTVLTGVVEEKQSRVVEVVLSTVRPRDLLMGKVLGHRHPGGRPAARLRGRRARSRRCSSAASSCPRPRRARSLLLTIWFILGYALYSTALGFLGALASRMEEASNASTPVTFVAMVSYFVAIFSVINDPSGPVAIVATYLPPSAPFVVPLRAAFDAIAPIEIVVSMIITIIGIWILFSIGARVYAGAVLQTAGRMKLRDAWRSAGE